MNGQRIIWFKDSLSFRDSGAGWLVDEFTQSLIDQIGHPNYEHVVCDPEPALDNLSRQLENSSFSAVVDLSGFLSERITNMGIGPVIGDFHLSRLRVASSPRLDGSGFLLSQDSKEIQHITDSFDFSRPLLVDDVAWSGRSVITACKALGIQPDVTTCAFITANVGNFGRTPGAKQLLEDQGMRVHFGYGVETPRDDGFHVEDFIPRHDSRLFMDAVITIQQMRELGAEDGFKDLLMNNPSVLFGDIITSDELIMLHNAGRVILPGGVRRDSLFTINPPNWLMPSFSRRTSSVQWEANRYAIIRELDRIKLSLNEDIERVNEIRFKGKEF